MSFTKKNYEKPTHALANPKFKAAVPRLIPNIL